MLNHATKNSDLTEKQYALLGRAFIEWSNIEYLLGVILSRLLFTPEFLGRTYSDQMNASHIESSIKNALDIHESRYNSKIVSKDLQHQIKMILKDSLKVRELRNKFAHYLWMRSNDKEIFGAKLSGKIAKPGRADSSINLTNNKLRDHYKDSYQVVERLRIILKALPDISEGLLIAQWPSLVIDESIE